MAESIQKVSDPQSVRALAHPLRLQLMELLATEAQLTATQCAELTGESVASCSFHLRMLAKYGYIEPADRQGREKPWRLKSRSREIRPDHDDPASLREVAAFAGLIVDREAARLQTWLGRSALEPREWIEASPIATTSLWLTVDEATEIAAELGELQTRLAERFEARRKDPASRPPEARSVHVFAAMSVDTDRDTPHLNVQAGPGPHRTGPS